MNTLHEENTRSYLEKMLAILDIDAVIHEDDLDESTRCYRIDCKPSDAKLLIGKQGQTLEALQFLLRQMCKGAKIEQSHFLLDVANYRQRRRETITSQAKEGAVAVLNGESEEVELFPMSAFERRIVHKYLQENFPELSSNSKGEDPERRIVISYVGESTAGEEEAAEEPEQESV